MNEWVLNDGLLDVELAIKTFHFILDYWEHNYTIWGTICPEQFSNFQANGDVSKLKNILKTLIENRHTANGCKQNNFIPSPQCEQFGKSGLQLEFFGGNYLQDWERSINSCGLKFISKIRSLKSWKIRHSPRQGFTRRWNWSPALNSSTRSEVSIFHFFQKLNIFVLPPTFASRTNWTCFNILSSVSDGVLGGSVVPSPKRTVPVTHNVTIPQTCRPPIPEGIET